MRPITLCRLPPRGFERALLMAFRWIEHTAELELEIEAASEEAVFEQALAALRELVAESDPAEVRGETIVREITVTAADRPALLAAWLEELVYLLETEDLVPERVERLELGEERLIARVKGHRGRPRHLVKGVTYHQLAFASDERGASATVVLDV